MTTPRRQRSSATPRQASSATPRQVSSATEADILNSLLADQSRLEIVIASGQANSEQIRRYSDIQAITRNYIRSFEIELPPLPRNAATPPNLEMLLNYCTVTLRASTDSGRRLLYLEVGQTKIYAPEQQTPGTTYQYIFGRSLPFVRQATPSGDLLVQFAIGDVVAKPDSIQVRIDGQKAGDSYQGSVTLTTK